MTLENPKKIIKIGVVGLFFLFIVVFALFNSRELLFGVKIKDISIVNGAKLTEDKLEVTGNAKHALKLSLNGREISINKDGYFKETIVLLPGYNVIAIRALDKFKHVDEKNYQLMYEAEDTL